MELTDRQRRHLRAIKNGNWYSSAISDGSLAFLIKNGLVKQRADALIQITEFGRRTIELKRTPQLYWAYGSNLNVKAMKVRCPGAKKIRALSLDDGALIFRGVADAIFREGSTVHGGLWSITADNERSLDAYEGVSGNLYRKEYLKLLVDGEERDCLYYQMNSQGIMPPSENYLNVILDGYKDFGLPLEALEAAWDESWGNKKPTRQLRRRHKTRGGILAKHFPAYLGECDASQE